MTQSVAAWRPRASTQPVASQHCHSMPESMVGGMTSSSSCMCSMPKLQRCDHQHLNFGDHQGQSARQSCKAMPMASPLLWRLVKGSGPRAAGLEQRYITPTMASIALQSSILLDCNTATVQMSAAGRQPHMTCWRSILPWARRLTGAHVWLKVSIDQLISRKLRWTIDDRVHGKIESG